MSLSTVPTAALLCSVPVADAIESGLIKAGWRFDRAGRFWYHLAQHLTIGKTDGGYWARFSTDKHQALELLATLTWPNVLDLQHAEGRGSHAGN